MKKLLVTILTLSIMPATMPMVNAERIAALSAKIELKKEKINNLDKARNERREQSALQSNEQAALHDYEGTFNASIARNQSRISGLKKQSRFSAPWHTAGLLAAGATWLASCGAIGFNLYANPGDCMKQLAPTAVLFCSTLLTGQLFQQRTALQQQHAERTKELDQKIEAAEKKLYAAQQRKAVLKSALFGYDSVGKFLKKRGWNAHLARNFVHSTIAPQEKIKVATLEARLSNLQNSNS